MTTFYEKVAATIADIPASPSLDVALLGSSLADAVQIEATDEVRRVSQREEHVGSLTKINFAELTAAFPPTQLRHLFVEFHSSSWSYVGRVPLNRAGLHIVPLADARTSVLFSKLPVLPSGLAQCTETYALVAYLERPQQVEVVHPMGMMVGLDQPGHLVERWPFPTDGKFPPHVNKDQQWQRRASQIGLLAYLVFACFMRVNQGEAMLRQVAPGRWAIG